MTTTTSPLDQLNALTIDELRAELDHEYDDKNVRDLAEWLDDGSTFVTVDDLIARINERLATEYDPEMDGPRNPCGFCGMREAAPGHTACGSCA